MIVDAELGDPNAAAAAAPLLRVENLSVEYETDRGVIEVVQGVSFDVEAGKTVGLVGESGSGKSVSARAVMGLVGSRGRISSGSVLLNGSELTKLSPKELSAVRGREVAMIFQEPRRSLDPAFTVGDQVSEVVRHNLGISKRDAWKRAVELLDLVRIPDASHRAKDYPHQFSGGMCQRVMLAIALAGSPKLLIADEPTTALDVTVQAHVLELIRELQRELGLGVLFITHDLGVVAEMCDRVIVLYAGQVVEDGPVRSIFRDPSHPYTEALLQSLPQLAHDRLFRIEGVMPAPGAWPEGCRFHTRCSYATDACRSSAIDVFAAGEQHWARCSRLEEIELKGVR